MKSALAVARTGFLLVALALVSTSASAQDDPVVVDGFVISGAEVVGGELDALDLVIDPLIEAIFTDNANRILFEVQDLDDDTYADDEEVDVAFYSGLDKDDDADDDFDGEDVFLIDRVSLNAAGEPLVLFTPGDITDSALTAGPATIDLTDLADIDLTDLDLGDIDLGDLDLEDLADTLEFEDVEFTGTFTDDGDNFTTDALEGAVPAAIFEEIEAPFPASVFFDTVYDWMTDDGLFGLGLTEDVDLDDDGVDDAFSIEVELTAVPCEIEFPVIGRFLRGDCDGNASVSALPDALYLMQWGFTDGPEPPCMDAADADNNGAVSVLGDALYILQWGFTNGDAPPDPGTGDCGIDPLDDEGNEEDELECAESNQDCA